MAANVVLGDWGSVGVACSQTPTSGGLRVTLSQSGTEVLGTVEFALPVAITGATAVTSGRLRSARLQWERRFVEVALARAGGNRSRTARDLGLTRQGLLKVLERLRISPSQTVELHYKG